MVKWEQDGNKYKKVHYQCGEHVNGCPAKKTVWHVPGTLLSFEGHHNHKRPSNPKLNPAVKRDIMKSLKTGSKPGKIYQDLVINSETIDKTTIPSMNDIQHQARSGSKVPPYEYVLIRTLKFPRRCYQKYQDYA